MFKRTRVNNFESGISLQPGPDEVIYSTGGIPLTHKASRMRLDHVVQLTEEVLDDGHCRVVSGITIEFVIVWNKLKKSESYILNQKYHNPPTMYVAQMTELKRYVAEMVNSHLASKVF